MELEKTCFFTGHRELGKEEERTLAECLKLEIQARIQAGTERFICGGALGFDTLAARMVLEAKRERPEIKLSLFLPCRDQAAFWPKAAQTAYQEILRQADDRQYCADSYYRGCMAERNRRMVIHSGVCICYLKKQSGGTAYTVQCAKRGGLLIINLAERLE